MTTQKDGRLKLYVIEVKTTIGKSWIPDSKWFSQHEMISGLVEKILKAKRTCYPENEFRISEYIRMRSIHP